MDAIATKGLGYERLDQLVIDLLLGVALDADGTPARHRRRHHRDARHPGGRGGRAGGRGRHPRVPAAHAAAAVGRAGSRRLVARHGRCRAGRARRPRATLGARGRPRDRALRPDARRRAARRRRASRSGARSSGATGAARSSATRSRQGRRRAAHRADLQPGARRASARPRCCGCASTSPRQWEQAKKFLLPKDYIRFRLTGEYASEVSDASGTLLFDVAQAAWSKRDAAAARSRRGLLPRGARVARGQRGACARTWRPSWACRAGTPVVGGGGDQAAGAVGNGVVRRGPRVVHDRQQRRRVRPLGRAGARPAAAACTRSATRSRRLARDGRDAGRRALAALVPRRGGGPLEREAAARGTRRLRRAGREAARGARRAATGSSSCRT